MVGNGQFWTIIHNLMFDEMDLDNELSPLFNPKASSDITTANSVLGLAPRGRSNGELPTVAAGFKRRISKGRLSTQEFFRTLRSGTHIDLPNRGFLGCSE